MGKRGKRRRAEEKKQLREAEAKLGRKYKYKVYARGATGELVTPKMSKAEHRRRWIEAVERRLAFEIEIIERVAKQAHDDICAVEDARVFADLRSIAGGEPASP